MQRLQFLHFRIDDWPLSSWFNFFDAVLAILKIINFNLSGNAWFYIDVISKCTPLSKPEYMTEKCKYKEKRALKAFKLSFSSRIFLSIFKWFSKYILCTRFSLAIRFAYLIVSFRTSYFESSHFSRRLKTDLFAKQNYESVF